MTELPTVTARPDDTSGDRPSVDELAKLGPVDFVGAEISAHEVVTALVAAVREAEAQRDEAVRKNRLLWKERGEILGRAQYAERELSLIGDRGDHVVYRDEWEAFDRWQRAVSGEAPTRATHGRHCPCSGCAREDWTRPDLASCGMHGPDCLNVYAPSGEAPTVRDADTPEEAA